MKALLIHASVDHYSCQLLTEFNITPLDSNTCSICNHDFCDRGPLLSHLGLAHRGLLSFFSEYRDCNRGQLIRIMESFRQRERELFSCRKCPSRKFHNMEGVVEHVHFLHCSKEIQIIIDKAVHSQPPGRGYTCLYCNRKLISWVKGLLHLERFHFQLFRGQPAYAQLIHVRFLPICNSSNVRHVMPVQSRDFVCL